MEETKATVARVSEEPPLNVSSSPECLPTAGPPNCSCHDDNVEKNHHEEKITNNAEEKVEQYIADVAFMGHKTPIAGNANGLSNNNQPEAVTEDPELSPQRIVSHTSLLGQTIAVDEIIDTNHQQGMLLKDSVPSVQQNVSSISPPDHKKPDSVEKNVSRVSVVDVEVMSSGHIAHSVPHLLETQEKELEISANQIQNGTSVNLVDFQTINSSITSTHSRKTESATSAKPVKNVYVNRSTVDTAAPFESVKEAVTKFGGIVDWKAHKQNTLEKRKQVQLELGKMQAEIPECKRQSEAAEESRAQVLKELDSTKRIIEELKLNLEKAQTEEAQAKQDSELSQLRVKEMEQGIANEASVAAKTQLEIAKARHEAAAVELKSVKDELKALQEQYVSLVNERDIAARKAGNAVSALKEIEKTVEELTVELITAKESLELAHAAHLEAEERRIGAALAREQDCLTWEKELKHAEEEVQQLNQQLLLTKDLQSKVETTSALLHNLKAELADYMESRLNQESESIEEQHSEDVQETEKAQSSIQALASTKKELEEVKASIGKAKDEVDCLRVASSSLKSELEKERASLMNLQQREAMASIAVSSLEAELDRTKQELEMVRVKEKAAREQMVELPKLLQQAAQEADQAKSVAQLAREELRKSKEEAEQAKATVSTIEIRLHAVLKEIEAARASERLALAAIKALQESEQAASVGGEDSPHTVTLPLDEYFNLSKRAHEAEELAHERVIAAIAQIEVAKQSEVKSLERLDEAYKEMRKRKEALKVATEKAEKAKEGKLGAEQDLRKWRAENEQRRRASDGAKSAVNSPRSPLRTFEQPTGLQISSKEETRVVDSISNPKSFSSEDGSDNSVPEVKTRKKKKSLVPKIVLFLGRKKSQPIK